MRKEFQVSTSLASGIIDATDQGALNEAWAALAREVGFVWTTVEALTVLDDDMGITFTADTEDVPADPAFLEWVASYPLVRKYPQLDTHVSREMMAAAFDAGRRLAAANLAAIEVAQSPMTEDQRERMIKTFRENAPVASPFGSNRKEIEDNLAKAAAVMDVGEAHFLRWIEPIVVAMETEDPSFDDVMAIVSAMKVLAEFSGYSLGQYIAHMPESFGFIEDQPHGHA